MARSEPTVPLVVYERMCEGYEAQIARLHDTIDRLTTPVPQVIPERQFTGPAWLSEAAEDLEYAKRTGHDPDLIKQLEAEADFERPIAEIFE